MAIDIDAGFVGRTIRTYSIVLAIVFPFGLFYFGIYPSIAILSGGVWGIVNLMLLTALIRSTIRPEGVEIEKAIVFGVMKLLLYAAGYALLTVPMLKPQWLLAGFTGVLVIMLLKSVGRVLTGQDNPQHHNKLQNAQ
jgi:hypothetical protein